MGLFMPTSPPYTEAGCLFSEMCACLCIWNHTEVNCLSNASVFAPRFQFDSWGQVHEEIILEVWGISLTADKPVLFHWDGWSSHPDRGILIFKDILALKLKEKLHITESSPEMMQIIIFL